MSSMEWQQQAGTGSVSAGVFEVQMLSTSARKRGGWVTFFFVSGAAMGLTLAGWGWLTNLIVYLIEEFNVKSIDATQISNVVNGSINLIPIIGAVIADSFLGSFHVVSISSVSSLLGIVILTLTASIGSLRPQKCSETGASFCTGPSKLQYAVLYMGIALASIGQGVVRFTLGTLGANQFDTLKDREIYINWFFVVFYVACVISSFVIVYVQDSISWGLGFGICVVANFLGLIIFLMGNRFYRHDKPQGSPYTDLARVVVAAIHKRNVSVSSESKDYYHGNHHGTNSLVAATPDKSFRFLNRAAMKTEGDINTDGSIAKPWRICTVQQVEDLKTLIRIIPVSTSTVILATPIVIQGSLTVLQALAMDRHLGPSFKIPPGSLPVIVLISSAIFIPLLDRFLFPTWQKLTGQTVRPLQRIGIGHVFNTLSMAISALVESKRLKIAHEHQQEQMLALWLLPQLIVVGIGEAFHFPGNVLFFYHEFPVSLKSTGSAMLSILIGIAFYLSTAVVDLIRNVTGWLPEDINHGRLDNVYWLFVVLGLLNFGYFLVCAKLYKYHNLDQQQAEDFNVT
ncbi:Proton-dependent oligopeptide transporter family [Corchorus olitorius]|uniref:Proton-dependent oligopeptide transporter family n=1 Tax=Corchorus olitorius TaxID=93759 RepID=A0A1R3J9G1_9ROSI|nr:Proton-dependent oligopeptide transporter family [Corchorus olitorius]